MSQRTSNDDLDHEATTETRHDDYDPNPDERGKWLSMLIGLLGAWIIIQAIIFDLAATQFWNDLLIGALLLAVGAYNYSRRADERLGNVAAAALVALLGLWLIAAPFILGIDAGATETANDSGFWNDIVVGLLALILGAYSAYKAHDRRGVVRGTTD